MGYTDFTLERVERDLGVTTLVGDLFPGLAPVAVPGWLTDLLRRTTPLAWTSEKARSEFLVAPILVAARELSGNAVTILSGQRLDVDAARGLQGECDFLIARGDPLPRLQAPLLAIVEAKKNDLEAGLGQCAAQAVAAQCYNAQAGTALPGVYGCVTTGEAWQFLRLQDQRLTLASQRLYIDNVAAILAALLASVAPGGPPPRTPA
jgi:hypothetical protein